MKKQERYYIVDDYGRLHTLTYVEDYVPSINIISVTSDIDNNISVYRYYVSTIFNTSDEAYNDYRNRIIDAIEKSERNIASEKNLLNKWNDKLDAVNLRLKVS